MLLATIISHRIFKTVAGSLLVIAVAICGVLALAAAGRKSPTTVGAKNSPALAAQDERTSDKPRISTEIISVTPRGFEPAEIVRPRGPFILRINNRSGLGELSLRLNNTSGNSVAAAALNNGKAVWNQALDLPPDSYIISEAGKPGWTCKLTITSQ
jgi:hypothetical protein